MQLSLLSNSHSFQEIYEITIILISYINIIPSLVQKYVNRLNGFWNNGFSPEKCIMKIRAFAYLQVIVKYYDLFNFSQFFTQIYQENFLKN
jgi:hypothetical protein